MSGNTYQGMSTDHYLAHNEQSTIHKMKKTYWTTKQAVMQKLGKKEDQHVIASDQELDAKLEVFKAIQMSSMELLRVIEKYQDRLFALSQEENSMGRLLKRNSQMDKTRAGKMMAAVGKSQSFSSQQRLALRVPLARLYQEVETFRYRAVSDMLITINRMEESRTNYRGALLWMNDVSKELDPDTYKQLDKFRKVQAQVKKTKARFDKLKLDTMQKIDLLAASRCNMFSHALANYQSTLLHFWEKTSRTMTVVSESFKGYQYFEFNMLKELCEPSKRLAEATREDKTEEEEDEEPGSSHDTKGSATPPPQSNTTTTSTAATAASDGAVPDLGDLQDLVLTDEQTLLRHQDQSTMMPPLIPTRNDQQQHTSNTQPIAQQLLQSLPQQHRAATPTRIADAADDHRADDGGTSGKGGAIEGIDDSLTGLSDRDRAIAERLGLISLGEGNASQLNRQDSGSMSNLLQDIDKEIMAPVEKSKGGEGSFITWQEDATLEEIKKKQEEEFGFHPKMFGARSQPSSGKGTDKNLADKGGAQRDILSGDLDIQDTEDKDDLTTLNEILGGDTSGSEGFSSEWQAVFGQTSMSRLDPSAGVGAVPVSSPANGSAASGRVPQTQQFLPSQLLDMNQQLSSMSLSGAGQPGAPPPPYSSLQSGGAVAPPTSSAPSLAGQPTPNPQSQPGAQKKGDMSAWYGLFADLDPLSNPDAVGKTAQQQQLSDAL